MMTTEHTFITNVLDYYTYLGAAGETVSMGCWMSMTSGSLDGGGWVTGLTGLVGFVDLGGLRLESQDFGVSGFSVLETGGFCYFGETFGATFGGRGLGNM